MSHWYRRSHMTGTAVAAVFRRLLLWDWTVSAERPAYKAGRFAGSSFDAGWSFEEDSTTEHHEDSTMLDADEDSSTGRSTAG